MATVGETAGRSILRRFGYKASGKASPRSNSYRQQFGPAQRFARRAAALFSGRFEE